MTKQNYEKPNMEIVMLEDVIKTSGFGNTTVCIPNECPIHGGVCSAVTVIGCNPDNLCSSDSVLCDSFSPTCLTDELGHSNTTLGGIVPHQP